MFWMAKASSGAALKEKEPAAKRTKKPADPLSARVAFDINTYDDFFLGNREPLKVKPESKVSRETFNRIREFYAGKKYIIGVDEVGRGCLAGPVVAAAVVLPGFEKKSDIARRLALLDDSKKLSPAIREDLSSAIQDCASVGIAEASPVEIDTINIFHASLLAMRRAVDQLVSSAMLDLDEALILIDGKWTLPELEANQRPVIKGDGRSASIAAASVVAKVYRDNLMIKLDAEFPQYKWIANKGYGSLVHRQAIQEHGMTVWHRRSFRCLPDEEYDDSDLDGGDE